MQETPKKNKNRKTKAEKEEMTMKATKVSETEKTIKTLKVSIAVILIFMLISAVPVICSIVTGSIWSEGIGNNTMCACLACALIINCSDLKKYEALRERENQEV